MMPGPSRISAILDTLPPDDALALSVVAEPAWQQRRRRLALRDAAVRAALALLADQPRPTARLAALLGNDGRGLPSGPLLTAVRDVRRWNDGGMLRERQVRNVARGQRSPLQ